MKKVVLAVTALALSACSPAGEDKPTVVATFTVLEDMVKNVAGDAVEVKSLTQPGDEIHGFDPTPSAVSAAAKADIVFSNGLGLENWLDRVPSDAEQVVASDKISPINIAGTDKPNPHAWMSPTLATTYVSNIERALASKYPEHAEDFRKNAENYRTQIEAVRDNLEFQPGTALMTCEGAFSYLAHDFGLKEGYIWPVNNEEVTAGQINDAIAFVKENDVPATFCESTVNTGPQEQVLKATGAENGGTLYVDSLSEEAPTYLDLLKKDTETIKNGLQ